MPELSVSEDVASPQVVRRTPAAVVPRPDALRELARRVGNRRFGQYVTGLDIDNGGEPTGLTSPRFKGDPTLEACYRDEARLSRGDRGEAVEKVQQALIELGYDLGPWGADGSYGSATWNGVKRFKSDELLGWETMGDVGPGTMRRLDELFPPEGHVVPRKLDAPRPLPGRKGKGGGPPPAPASDAPELISGTASFRNVVPWGFTVPNPPSSQMPSYPAWDVRTEFTTDSTLRLDMPLNGSDWDVGLVQNVWWDMTEYEYPPPLGKVSYQRGGPMLDVAAGEPQPFMHGYQASVQNPSQHVSRTAPAIDPTAFPNYTDKPAVPIRRAVPLNSGSGLPHVDPISCTSFLHFTVFPVARHPGGELRVLAVPSWVFTTGFKVTIPSFTTPATVTTLPGSLVRPIKFLKIARDQQAPDFNMLRTSGMIAVDAINAAREAAFKHRGYRSM